MSVYLGEKKLYLPNKKLYLGDNQVYPPRDEGDGDGDGLWHQTEDMDLDGITCTVNNSDATQEQVKNAWRNGYLGGTLNLPDSSFPSLNYSSSTSSYTNLYFRDFGKVNAYIESVDILTQYIDLTSTSSILDRLKQFNIFGYGANGCYYGTDGKFVSYMLPYNKRMLLSSETTGALGIYQPASMASQANLIIKGIRIRTYKRGENSTPWTQYSDLTADGVSISGVGYCSAGTSAAKSIWSRGYLRSAYPNFSSLSSNQKTSYAAYFSGNDTYKSTYLKIKLPRELSQITVQIWYHNGAGVSKAMRVSLGSSPSSEIEYHTFSAGASTSSGAMASVTFSSTVSSDTIRIGFNSSNYGVYISGVRVTGNTTVTIP